MSSEEKGYPDYLAHSRGILSALALFCGFLFSAITLLVANFPNLDPFLTQIVLFFLIAIFDLCLYTIVDAVVMGIYYCRRIPPLTKHLRFYNFRLLLSFYSIGVAALVLLLLRNLFYLSVASGVIWVVVMISSYITIVKPFNEFRNQMSTA